MNNVMQLLITGIANSHNPAVREEGLRLLQAEQQKELDQQRKQIEDTHDANDRWTRQRDAQLYAAFKEAHDAAHELAKYLVAKKETEDPMRYKFEALKALRDMTGLGLYDAKNWIDRVVAERAAKKEREAKEQEEVNCVIRGQGA